MVVGGYFSISSIMLFFCIYTLCFNRTHNICTAFVGSVFWCFISMHVMYSVPHYIGQNLLLWKIYLLSEHIFPYHLVVNSMSVFATFFMPNKPIDTISIIAMFIYVICCKRGQQTERMPIGWLIEYLRVNKYCSSYC